MPPGVDDDDSYISGFAAYVAENLNEGLQAYLEYGTDGPGWMDLGQVSTHSQLDRTPNCLCQCTDPSAYTGEAGTLPSQLCSCPNNPHKQQDQLLSGWLAVDTADCLVIVHVWLAGAAWAPSQLPEPAFRAIRPSFWPRDFNHALLP